MKKIFYSILAAAAMLFAVGCQQEKTLTGNEREGLTDVNFQVSLEALQTKANTADEPEFIFSDGKKATKLNVLVYTLDPTPVYLEKVSKVGDNAITVEDLHADVALKLVRGMNYKIAFWAQAPGQEFYTLDPENGTMTVNFEMPADPAVSADPQAGLPANNDFRDAFYGTWEGQVKKEAINEGVELCRPFSQISVLTSKADFEAAEANTIKFAGSSMTVKGLPNVLDLISGEVSGEKDYEFLQAPCDTTMKIAGYEGKYKYLAMNYVLADKTGIAKTHFDVYREQGKLGEGFDIESLPVGANRRTLIVGDIFCVSANFAVTILNSFDEPTEVVLLNGEEQPITTTVSEQDLEAAGITPVANQPNSYNAAVAVEDELDFSVFVSEAAQAANIKPIYTSSNPEVGEVNEGGIFEPKNPGETDVNIHYPAIMNGQAVKSEDKNYNSADVTIHVVVTAQPVAAPVFKPEAGEVEAGTKVTISCDTEEAVIYFKIGEGEYQAYDAEAGIEISEAVTITAIAKKEGMNDSEEVVAAYTIKAASGDEEDFSSNVEFAGVNSAYTDNVLNVNGVEKVANMKFGTSSKFGDGTISLPAGTTAVSFYAIGWKGADASLKFTVGETEFTVDVAGNDGATGNSPYTVTVTDSDKYSLEFAAPLAAATTVKVETYAGTNSGKRAFIFAINATATETPEPQPTDGFVIDGKLKEWADVEAQEGFAAVKEWKYGFNADSLCLYFKIARSNIIAAKTDDPSGSGKFPFNWRRYMGFEIDTDNNAETGFNPKFIGINDPDDPDSAINGCEAWGIFYPFRGNASSASGTDNLEIVNGVETQSAVAVIKEGVSKPDADANKLSVVAFGEVDDDYAYLEVGVPLAGIGNPAKGTPMNIRLSFSYDLSPVVTITR